MGGYYHLLKNSKVYYITFLKICKQLQGLFFKMQYICHKFAQTTTTNYKEEHGIEQDIQRTECNCTDTDNCWCAQLVVDWCIWFQPGQLDYIRFGLVGTHIVYLGRNFRYLHVGVAVLFAVHDDCKLRNNTTCLWMRQDNTQITTIWVACWLTERLQFVWQNGFLVTKACNLCQMALAISTKKTSGQICPLVVFWWAD